MPNTEDYQVIATLSCPALPEKAPASPTPEVTMVNIGINGVPIQPPPRVLVLPSGALRIEFAEPLTLGPEDRITYDEIHASRS